MESTGGWPLCVWGEMLRVTISDQRVVTAMRIKLFPSLIAAQLLISCDSRQVKQAESPTIAVERDTLVIHDTIRVQHQSLDWQKEFGVTHDPEKDRIWGRP